jgi:hypothetical protein
MLEWSSPVFETASGKQKPAPPRLFLKPQLKDLAAPKTQLPDSQLIGGAILSAVALRGDLAVSSKSFQSGSRLR